MIYTCIIDGDNTFAFLEDKKVGVFDTDLFLEEIISPSEFKQFEKNPLKKLFNIRKLEFNLFNIL